MRYRTVLALFIALFIVISGIVYSGMKNDIVLMESADEKTFDSIKVDVAGAVESPGVYALNFDSRAEDAIKAAGGFSPDADPDYVNKADFLRDGDFLYVPYKGESPDEIYLKMNRDINLENTPDYLININEDGFYKLTLIPGIGEKTAKNIVEYREENGRFSAKEDLLNVPGIGEATLEKISDYITLE